jgi:protein-disulfide isomerase
VIDHSKALSRRAFHLSTAAAAFAGAAGPALAQRRGAGLAEVPVAELMKKTEIQEMSLGNADAKVTIVEYASLTCPACANFNAMIMPKIKAKYIDPGKVRFVLRIWPRDTRDAGAYMLALCAGGDKAYPLVSALFQRQRDWAFTQGSPTEKLLDIAKQVGFTKETFEKCLTDQKLLDQITAERDRAANVFGVEVTPTFFVNGRRMDGNTEADFDKVLEPLLKSA